jgi:hypothetical protein
MNTVTGCLTQLAASSYFDKACDAVTRQFAVTLHQVAATDNIASFNVSPCADLLTSVVAFCENGVPILHLDGVSLAMTQTAPGVFRAAELDSADVYLQHWVDATVTAVGLTTVIYEAVFLDLVARHDLKTTAGIEPVLWVPYKRVTRFDWTAVPRPFDAGCVDTLRPGDDDHSEHWLASDEIIWPALDVTATYTLLVNGLLRLVITPEVTRAVIAGALGECSPHVCHLVLGRLPLSRLDSFSFK